MASDDALSAFLHRLGDKHTDPELVFSLRLAATGLDALSRAPPEAPAIAVVGPTQTGKSTVVNVLAGGEHMEASPLAAHTQRASVLAVNSSAGQGYLPASLAGAPRLEARDDELDDRSCLIWDTPDFDSNASAVYRQQVAQVCALVDLVVVVLSKEKYADQSVWSVMEGIAPLGTPVIICLNKCDTGPGGGSADADVLLPALRRRLDEHPEVAPDAPVFALPLVPAGALDALLAHPDVRRFRELVFGRLRRVERADRRAGLGRVVQANWSAWVEPVERELACHREWTALLQEHARSFLERYRSEYIDHARHHDVAQKAILGLLELLEFPALAGPMSKTRRVLTWPFRKTMSALGRGQDPDRDQELEVVEAALNHCLLSLQSEVVSRRDPWWRALGAELSEREPEVRQQFDDSMARYRKAFQPRIDRLSEELYLRLKQNPVTLNALRATRFGADAGGIVFAIKTGTLGLYDALFAPAVISLTSYLTESAVGQYLRTVIASLKREQVEQVSAVIRGTIEQPLSALQPGGPDLFGFPESELARARERAKALRS